MPAEFCAATGTAEAVEVTFDPQRISYRDLLEFFFQFHRPDLGEHLVGSSYRSHIFCTSPEQRKVAEETIRDVDASGYWPGKVVTEISQARPFWEAAAEDQTYFRRSRLMRSVSPAALAVTVSLLIGGAGFADAATGGTFILGKANSESSTASLANSKGTPLALSAPAGKAPLAVNQKAMVKNLNAQYLGGLTAGGLAETGGVGYSQPATDTGVSSAPTVVATTGQLPPGIYYVTASAELQVAAGDVAGTCYIVQGSAPDTAFNTGGAHQEGEFTVAETTAVRLTATDTFQEICSTLGTSGSVAYDAGIFAIRILSSTG